MKPTIHQLVGKTITRVMVTEGNTGPCSQLFLFFSDGTYYEFYCSDSIIEGTKGLHSGTVAEVEKHIPSNRTTLKIFETQV